MSLCMHIYDSEKNIINFHISLFVLSCLPIKPGHKQ